MIHPRSGWFRLIAVYIFLVAAVVSPWHLRPAWFLLGFLTISTRHSPGDPAARTPCPAHALSGGAIVTLPKVPHAEENTRLFALIVGMDAATLVTP